MIKTMEWVPNPDYKPENSAWQSQGKYVYKDADRNVRENDIVSFSCNGRGRGGHYRVTALVTKVSPKTFKATEMPRSYRPGTRWSVSFASAGDIVINLSQREFSMATRTKAEEAMKQMGIEYRIEPCNSNGFNIKWDDLFDMKMRRDACYVAVAWKDPEDPEVICIADFARGGLTYDWVVQNDGFEDITLAQWKQLRIVPECDWFEIPKAK